MIYRLQVGGLENGVVNLVNQLPEDRFRHAIVCLKDYTDFRDRITRDDVEVVALHKKEGQDFGAWVRMYRLFRQWRPAIVHSRNLGCLEAQIPAWLARVPGRVHGEHGWDVSDPFGTVRKYQVLRRLHAPLIHRFIPLSRELEDYLLQPVGIRPQKITRIYNGVDVQRFHPGESTILPAGFADQDSVIFGTVGRMHGVKDQGNLTEAFLLLRQQYPELADRARLVLVGDGPLREQCRSMLDAAGASRSAWLPGARNDIADVLRAYDVFVLPSKAEGISNTILEAMASGLPVIATAVGGNGELINDGTTGTLVPKEDPQALAAAMASYLSGAERRTSHGSAGLQRILDNFSMQRMLDAYSGVYDQVLAAKERH